MNPNNKDTFKPPKQVGLKYKIVELSAYIWVRILKAKTYTWKRFRH